MTSPASLKYSDEEKMLTGKNFLDEYVSVIMPKKIDLEIEYFTHQSIFGDISIIFKTIRKVFV